MIVMAPKRRPPAFSPSIYEPEKRDRQFTLRLTDSEFEVLEREAAKHGVTALNMIRKILAARLVPRRKRTRGL